MVATLVGMVALAALLPLSGALARRQADNAGPYLEGEAAGDGFGYALAAIGDVDGDGVPDLAVGAPGADPGDRDRAGVATLISGATGHWLLRLEGSEPLAHLGTSLAGVGDVDHDGVPDWVVGAPYGSGRRPVVGRAFLVSGADGTILSGLEGAVPIDRLGETVVGVGDTDADGTPDWAIGSPGANRGKAIETGRIAVLSGSTGEVLLFLAHRQERARLGASLTALSDVDGDGVAELLVGAPWARTERGPAAGKALVVSGSTGQVLAQRGGEAAREFLGTATVGVGDVDTDGIPDWAVGAPRATVNGHLRAGYAVLVSGGDGQTLARVEGATTDERLGAALAAAGDVDGDGVPDWLVGAPAAGVGGQARGGRVLLVSGSSGRPILELTGTAPGDRFGAALASVGDIDADGVPDWAVGSPGASPGGRTGAGRVVLISAAMGEPLRLSAAGQATTDSLLPRVRTASVATTPLRAKEGGTDVPVVSPRDSTPSGVWGASGMGSGGSFPAGWVGSDSCSKCHLRDYKEWLESGHAKTAAAATPENVRGDFGDNNVVTGIVYTPYGSTPADQPNTVRMLRENGSYVAEFDRSDPFIDNYLQPSTPPPYRFPISFVQGRFFYQAYLTRLPKGEVYVLPVVWDDRADRWYMSGWRPWALGCGNCHATGLAVQGTPRRSWGILPETDPPLHVARYTAWMENAVACEFCHGPNEDHVRTLGAAPLPDLDRDLSLEAQVALCGTCHGLGFGNPRAYRLGDTFEEIPDKNDELPSWRHVNGFWPDGEHRSYDTITNGFMSTAHYRAGLSCTTCHPDHARGLRLPTSDNRLCTQPGCHAAELGFPSHTRHAADSSGANCVACHMPANTGYTLVPGLMLMTQLASHSLSIPNPQATLEHGVPNACNLCHTDRQAAWALEAMQRLRK
ncbi:MAG: hypothetical protein ACE5I7_18915 [Candidatus Binatia bacterium]